MNPFLEKAVDALTAARRLTDDGHSDSAASRSYYAVFHATRAALIHAGRSALDQRWSHEAIQGELSALTRLRKVYPAHLVADFRSLQDTRLMADYRSVSVSGKAARRGVAIATVFVAAVKERVIAS